MKSFLAGNSSPHLVDTIDPAETLSSKSAVRQSLIDLGFKLRGQGKPDLRPSNVAYGFRMVNGTIVAHLSEQRVIASVKKMVADGMSYRKVCEFLNSVGVPTKCRGHGWQPEMVRRLIYRNT